MRKLFLFALLLPGALMAQKATIKVDVERVIGKIDPLIY